MAYSQKDEEQVIVQLAERQRLMPGRFLDIGAYDGKTFSNTLRLVELGWSGVCVEPSPSVFVGLMKCHAEHPGITLVNAAVDVESGWAEFYDSGGDAVSTSDPCHAVKWTQNAGVKFTKFHLFTLSIAELFLRFGTDFDFINIDVEGNNWKLFCAMPWNMLTRTRIVCVEYDAQADQMMKLMAEHSFAVAHRTSENLIFSKI